VLVKFYSFTNWTTPWMKSSLYLTPIWLLKYPVWTRLGRKALQPRRQPSSYSPPWEPQTLLRLERCTFWSGPTQRFQRCSLRHILFTHCSMFITLKVWKSCNRIAYIQFKLWECVCSLIARKRIHWFVPNLAWLFFETIRDFRKVKTPNKCPGFEIRWGWFQYLGS
jgi:hypothetical protein